MRLIGSRQEDLFRQELEASAIALASKSNLRTKRLAEMLEDVGVNLDEVLVFDWFPEQLEDVYHLLVGTDTVLVVEIPHDTKAGATSVERENLGDFVRKSSKGMSRPGRLKLAVAVDVAKKRNQST